MEERTAELEKKSISITRLKQWTMIKTYTIADYLKRKASSITRLKLADGAAQRALSDHCEGLEKKSISITRLKRIKVLPRTTSGGGFP